MPQRRAVTLLTDTSSGYSRGVMRGVVRYARGVGNWHLRTRPVWDFGPGPAVAPSLTDGVIAMVSNLAMQRQLQKLGRPVVNVANQLEDTGFATVLADDHAVGRMAAEHFLDRGFRHFAYAGYMEMSVARERLAGYRQRLKEAGIELEDRRVANASDHDMGPWVAQLPRPCALFTMSDGCSAHVLGNALDAGVAVPEQLAILGVDDDEFLISLSTVTLSSIELPLEQIGYEAAMLLDRQMEGRCAASRPESLRLAPLQVITRHSSDVLAINDEDVALALRYLREHATERSLRADQVVHAVAVSRRSLERRFRQLLGRSILDEIHRVRIARVRELLTTSLDLDLIALRAGFTNPNRLHIVFRKLMGTTPAQYRRRARPSAGR